MRSKVITEQAKLRYLGFLQEVYEVCQKEQPTTVTKTKRGLSKKHKLNAAVWTPLYQGGVVRTEGNSKGNTDKPKSQLVWVCNDPPSIHMAAELIKRVRTYCIDKAMIRSERKADTEHDRVEAQRKYWRESAARKRARDKAKKETPIKPISEIIAENPSKKDEGETMLEQMTKEKEARHQKGLANLATKRIVKEALRELAAEDANKYEIADNGEYLTAEEARKIEVPTDRPSNILIGVGGITIEIKVG